MGNYSFSDDYGEVYKNRPSRPVSEKEINIDIVGTRCVYLNNYRIAGGKPQGIRKVF